MSRLCTQRFLCPSNYQKLQHCSQQHKYQHRKEKKTKHRIWQLITDDSLAFPSAELVHPAHVVEPREQGPRPPSISQCNTSAGFPFNFAQVAIKESDLMKIALFLQTLQPLQSKQGRPTPSRSVFPVRAKHLPSERLIDNNGRRTWWTIGEMYVFRAYLRPVVGNSTSF